MYQRRNRYPGRRPRPNDDQRERKTPRDDAVRPDTQLPETGRERDIEDRMPPPKSAVEQDDSIAGRRQSAQHAALLRKAPRIMGPQDEGAQHAASHTREKAKR